MPEPSPRVSVVVVQRETFAHTRRSIESLYATAGAQFELIYVDGGSPPAVQRAIEEASARHGFRVLRREHFLVPNEARNLGAMQASSEFVALVDNDVIFGDDWLRRLIACADETGADVVGPLICIGSPPYRTVHSAGGEARIVQDESTRRLHLIHRFMNLPLAGVAGELVREPHEMLELHCMLVRRTVFDRTGFFDEALLTTNEHVDFSLRVRQDGGTMMFEPRAVVNQLLPRLFPFDHKSLPFFYERWSRSRNRASVDHFMAKWNLPAGDHESEETYRWSNDRRDVLFRYLRLHYFRYGIRKLQRISRRLVQRA